MSNDMEFLTPLQLIQQRKRLLIQYLRMKTEEEDWHGVADAAMDLRELEVKIALTSGQSKS